jgi:hypothetical protein
MEGKEGIEQRLQFWLFNALNGTNDIITINSKPVPVLNLRDVNNDIPMVVEVFILINLKEVVYGTNGGLFEERIRNLLLPGYTICESKDDGER